MGGGGLFSSTSRELAFSRINTSPDRWIETVAPTEGLVVIEDEGDAGVSVPSGDKGDELEEVPGTLTKAPCRASDMTGIV